jgi:phenylacetate-CoA ligase
MSAASNEALMVQAEQSALPPSQLRDATIALLARATWNRIQIETFQMAQLKRLLQYAIEYSPYYAKTIGPALASGAPFEEYPTLNKQQLMDNFDQIVTDHRLSRRLVEKHIDGENSGKLLNGEYRTVATSGTTGRRGVFIYNHDAWLNVMAVIARAQRLSAVETNARSVGIGAPAPMHISGRMFAERRASHPEIPRLDVTMPLEKIVAALNLYQPEIITTYPSFMRILAYEQEAGRLQIAPKMFRSAAEALVPEVCSLILEIWGCPVFQGYACSEAGSIANECNQKNGMHIAEDHLIFETVGDNNVPLANCLVGQKCLITPLSNFALPLIRYELSDLVAVSNEPCLCGQSFARITSIEGRREERMTFTGPDGAIVEIGAIALQAPLIAMQQVKQFQFIHRHDHLKLCLALTSGTDQAKMKREVETALLQTLRAKNIKLSSFEIEIVDVIDRSGSSAKEKNFTKSN